MSGLQLGRNKYYSNNHNVTQVFQCTRHATSCNNIDMGKTFGKDNEPALSVYGIKEATALARREKEKGSDRFKMPRTPEGALIPIAVSALIRTWETAVLLYGYNAEGKKTPTLEIRICPWLKEEGWIGNTPKPLKHSIPKFLKFLNKLYNNYDPTHTNYNIEMIIIYIPPRNTKKNELPAGDANDENRWQQIVITLKDGTYEVTNLCLIVDTLEGRDEYQKSDGDLMKFMTWYTERFTYSPTTMHIVAHSHIMQDFFKKHLNIALNEKDGKAELKKLNPHVDENITENNCWSITMSYRDQYNEERKNEIIKSIKNGFPKPSTKNTFPKLNNNGTPQKSFFGREIMESAIERAQSEERTMQTGDDPTSLCGKSGSVKEISCASGGRRKRSKRRKRSYRKKTRRHRR